MKKYLLSNRVRNAILLAILLQSVIFGIGLLVTGTFSGTVNRPYKVMESQVSEKNSLLSGYMNNVLLLSNTMEKELGRMSDKKEIQNRLIDNLNHSSSADGIFYIDLDNREALVFHDGEPDIYSSTYGDISCVIGNPESSYSIALARNWRPKLSDEDWADAGQFWDMRSSGGTWFFNDERMYYVLTQEKKGDRLIMGLEISRDMLDTYLKLDNPPYGGMAVLLLSEDNIRYSVDPEMEGTGYTYDEKSGHISLNYKGTAYDGVRSVLQTYGYMDGGAVYVAAVCHHSELAALSYSTVLMVAGVYLFSILIAMIFSYIAIWIVLKPIQKLQEDITDQKPEEVHFKESGIVEIDRIHQALNDMAAKLEQSYSRYSFAMESAGDNVGSFEYQDKAGKVKLSPSIWHLLDIRPDRRKPVGEMDYGQWQDILGRMERIHELEDGYSFVDQSGNRRAVSIRQRTEENGVFGMMIDKTDAYKEIVRLRNISQHDQLTGLYNAAYLKKEGQKILDDNRNMVNALVFCDLDNLKYINDNFGHEMGDRYLKAMADMLADMAAQEQCVAVRLSGDEFVLFFYGYSDRETILNKVEEGYGQRPLIHLPDGTNHRINASVGLAFAQRETERMDDLINRADRAMYRVKHGNKNGIAVYDKSDEAGPA